LHHHGRFYAAALVGLVVGLILGTRGSRYALLAAGDVFFATYLVSAFFVARRAMPTGLRKHAAHDDEGIALILVLTLVAIGIAVTAILLLLREDGPRDPVHVGVALATVPLGWLTLHTIMAFHYAHLYYAQGPDGGDAGGLDFHDEEDPAAFDFVYHALIIGMTGGVADVEIHSRRMRRVATVHGVFSFFFNTVVLALAVAASIG
jgi:uncharacterized membrane protein